jgi:hypothetical protein
MATAKPIKGRYQLTIREQLRFAPALNRGTAFGFIATGVFVVLALLSLIDGTYVLAAIELALAAAVISGYYCLPFAWFTLRRHRAAAEAPVDVVVDAEGLEFTNAGVRLELPWVRIASVKETPTVFFLMSRYPRAFLLPKRAFDKGQLAAFRKLAASLTTFRPV